MRITVGLPSRNRPAGLLSVLTALDRLAAGFHDVTYAVVLDDDDYVTLEQWDHWKRSGMLPGNVREFIGPRDKTLNARMNDAYRQCEGDFYSQVADDQFPMSLHWDAMFYACRTMPAFCWTEATDAENATFLVVSRRWFEITGQYTTEYFPFWFADTWLAEVYRLAFGMPISVINQLLMGHGRRGGTLGMRDLGFWFKFFAATRCERIAQAQAISDAYGQSVDIAAVRQEEIAAMQHGDAFQLQRVPQFELNFSANLGVATPVYIAAKARADAWLSAHAPAVAEAA